MQRAIHWFRRDLRLDDNTALAAAAQQAREVVPVFIVEDAFRTGPDVGAARLQFLLDSVAELRDALGRAGHRLVIRHGRAEEILPALVRETGAQAVFCNIRYEPYAQARDARVFNILNAAGVGMESFKDAVVWHQDEILTQAGNPFTVFTPYSKAWKVRAVPAPRPSFTKASCAALKHIPSDTLPRDAAELGFPCRQDFIRAGETAARVALEEFMRAKVLNYGTTRNVVDVDGTSRLSPHLRAGTLGIRTVLAALARARARANPEQAKHCEVFLNELIWREFYLQVLHNFPHVTRGAFRKEYDALEWGGSDAHFEAWCAGQTGYPIVDAAMRCLNATGWMHNRLRMIVAMFLTKDLLVHWQRGERYFMRQLVDGDMAANNGGWQWSAGTGTDAAPYFRIFNPTTQGMNCDPNGDFVRRWIPELAALRGAAVHEPWNEPLLAAKYPPRILRHEDQRAKALAMFKRLKG